MKSYVTSKTLIIGAAILLIGTAVAFAHGGYGGNMMGYGGGYAMGPGMMGYGSDAGGYGMGPGMMGYGPGYAANGNGYGTDLSDGQRARLKASQEKFYNETQGLREKIQDQRNALQTELGSDRPDAAKVQQLQKSLSGLQAQFNQKAVAHQLELRKIAPEAAAGRTYGGNGQGYGGSCWQ